VEDKVNSLSTFSVNDLSVNNNPSLVGSNPHLLLIGESSYQISPRVPIITFDTNPRSVKNNF
jgi:hypothetical protein